MGNVAHNYGTMQDHQEGEHKVNKDDRRTTEFVRGLLNDYGTQGNDGFGLDVLDLPFYMRKLFLVIFTDRDHYYDCDDDHVNAAIARNLPAMQAIVNRNAESVCREILADLHDHLDAHRHDNHFAVSKVAQRHWLPCGISCDHDDWFTQTYSGY